jgi:hypothetical protein
MTKHRRKVKLTEVYAQTSQRAKPPQIQIKAKTLFAKAKIFTLSTSISVKSGS